MRVVQNYWATFYIPVFNAKSLVIDLSGVIWARLTSS